MGLLKGLFDEFGCMFIFMAEFIGGKDDRGVHTLDLG